jgi:hypothetical protein
MDAVTRNVLRMIDEDTMGAPASNADAIPHMTKDPLLERKDHPIGDVSGRQAAPKVDAGGIEQDAMNQKVPDAKPAVAPGMDSEELFRNTPNAMGRMARMMKS